MTHPRISAAEAHRLMVEEGYDYLDVRTQAEFDQGHPAGAFNIPIKLASAQGMQDNPRFMEVAGAVFDKQRKLIVGCKAGPRSQVAVAALIAAGYGAVVELGAGFGGKRDPFGKVIEPGWQAAGLPASTTSEPGRDYAALERTR